MKRQGQNPPLLKTFFSKIICYGFSYVTPVVFFGGEPFRYAVFKEESSIPSGLIISSIIVDKIIFFVVNALSFVMGLAIFLIYAPILLKTKIIILLSLALGVLLALFLLKKLKKIIKEKGFVRWLVDKFYLSKFRKIRHNYLKISEIENEAVKLLKSKKTVSNVFLLCIIELCFVLTAYWLIIYWLGHLAGIEKVLAVNGMIGLSYVVPLPAALGSLEMGQSFLFNVFQLSSDSGIVFSLIVRGLNLIIVFMGGLLFVWFQVKLIKRKILNFFKEINE